MTALKVGSIMSISNRTGPAACEFENVELDKMIRMEGIECAIRMGIIDCILLRRMLSCNDSVSRTES